MEIKPEVSLFFRASDGARRVLAKALELLDEILASYMDSTLMTALPVLPSELS